MQFSLGSVSQNDELESLHAACAMERQRAGLFSRTPRWREGHRPTPRLPRREEDSLRRCACLADLDRASIGRHEPDTHGAPATSVDDEMRTLAERAGYGIHPRDTGHQPKRRSDAPQDEPGWSDVVAPAYKANLSDVHASIALVQFAKLDRHRQIREHHVGLYDDSLADIDGITPLARDPRDVHALHLYIVRIDAERAGATRDGYQHALADAGIGTSVHFLPVHRLSWYRERFSKQPPLAVAERAGGEVLSLPLSPAHSDEDVMDVIAALRRAHARFTA